jgi:hypothetical protein
MALLFAGFQHERAVGMRPDPALKGFAGDRQGAFLDREISLGLTPTGRHMFNGKLIQEDGPAIDRNGWKE